MLNEFFNTGAADGGTIERSLRFNSADSAYLSRTPSTAGNRKTWTWAGWVKLAAIADNFGCFFDAGTGSVNNNFRIHPEGDITFRQFDGSTLNVVLVTTQLFRDYSAWYHLVLTYDSSNATSSDRVRLYVNGERITAFTNATYPSSDLDSYVNSTNEHRIGTSVNSSSTRRFDGYLADIHFIDGQALDPTSFGEFDDNGIWQPIAYSGSYGTNGFHLRFSDNSTAAALGTDTSGNGNTWTVNNISVAAGAGNDSVVDVPTNGTETDTGVGGEVRGNYCIMNPLDTASGRALSLTNGNLEHANPSTLWRWTRGTFAMTTGKWYWEQTVSAGATGSEGYLAGVATASFNFDVGTVGLYARQSNAKYDNGTTSQPFFSDTTSGDILGFAFDADAGKLWVSQNGTFIGSPTAGTGNSWSSVPAGVFPLFAAYNVTGNIMNFGARSFAYTAPSGFKALNTANLDPPTIGDPSTVMDVVTYTGDGAASGHNISTTTNPDLVWIKSRSISTGNHFLFDSVRGAIKVLGSNQTIVEYNNNDFALGTGQFTVGHNGGSDDYNPNKNNATYVAWAWDAGSSTVTNNDGSITSSVRANPSAGFSIVTYTGTGSSSTVGHGLGIQPELLIVKNRTTDFDWAVYHSALGGTKYLDLNTTDAVATAQGRWNNTNPTTTVFYIGNSNATNQISDNYVAYCFAPVSGYSAMGSYTGNGSADGPFVFLNFRARWIMFKRVAAADPWIMYDTARSPYNQLAVDLAANDSRAEAATSAVFDITSNGFKLRNSGTIFNQNGSQYIYCAFAESPFQYARAR